LLPLERADGCGARNLGEVAQMDAEVAAAVAFLLARRPKARLVVAAFRILDAASQVAPPGTRTRLHAQRAFESCLERVLEAAGDDATLLLVSPYGRAPPESSERRFSLDPLLARLGLLAPLPNGGLDEDATYVFDEGAPPASAERRLRLHPRRRSAADSADPGRRAATWEAVLARLSQLKVSTSEGAAAPLLRFEPSGGDGDGHLVRVTTPRSGAFLVEGPDGGLPADAVFPRLLRAERPSVPGVLLLAEPGRAGVRSRPQRELPLGQSPPSLLQIAPTILALFELPAPGTLERRRAARSEPPEMLGRPLYWMVDREFAERVSLRRLDYARLLPCAGPHVERDRLLAAEQP
jgi:hypothetical protein